MKPIYLKFVGLHSYINEAHIDFERAIKNGIFGIFGKTGHGKSTILDAITFALYGKIERLGASIHEAVNPAVGKIQVDFVFESENNRFRIVRSYRKNRQKLTAYEWHNGKWIPEAEKKHEFDDFVRKVIGGLSFHDFTRVVILPQGKFAAFLELQGSKRAEMLERIFNLELYGQPLWDTIREELIKLNTKVETLRTQLEAVSYADEALLGKLKEDYTRMNDLIRILEAGLERLGARRNEFAKAAELGERHRQAVERLKNHLLGRNRIEELRQKLKVANELAHLEGVFRRMYELQEQIPQLKDKLQGINSRLERFVSKQRDIRRSLEDFEARHRVEMGRIAAERERIKQAQKMLQELKNSRDEFNRLSNEIKKLHAKRGRIENEIDAIDKKMAPVSSKIAKLDAEAGKLRSEIERISSSVTQERVDKIERILVNLNDARNEFRLLRSRMEPLEESLKEEWRRFRGGELPPPFELIEDELRRQREEMERRIEEAEQHLQELERRSQAAVLALTLEDGKPCPVCGSPHHPAPAKRIEDDRIAEARKMLKELKGKLKAFNEFQTSMLKLVSELGSLKKRLKELEKHGRALKNELAVIVGVQPSAPELDEKAHRIVEQFKKANALSRRLNKLREEQAQLRKGFDELRTTRDKMSKDLMTVRSEAARYEEKRSLVEEKIRVMESDIRKLIGHGDPDELLKGLDREEAAIERKFKELKDRLNKITEDVDGLKAEKERTETMLRTREKDLTEAVSALEEEAKRRGWSLEEMEKHMMSGQERSNTDRLISEWDRTKAKLESEVERLELEMEQLSIEPHYASVMMGKLDSAILRLKDRISALKHRAGELSGQIRNVMDDMEKAAGLRSELALLEPELARLEHLEKVLHGKALVKFASRFLLSEIIHEANRLLDRLVMGRLTLTTPDSSLNFMVVDHLTGSRRSAKTLSGGEKFLVSFALSLALSNYIQKVRARTIDFFFIDEGFGTLDQESQLVVGRVLEEMMREGRVVGLITHIETYREMLPAYFLVEKDAETGSHVQYIGP